MAWSQPISLSTHAPCPDCAGPMALSYIEPAAHPGYDKCVFRCWTCGYQDSITRQIDNALRMSRGKGLRSVDAVPESCRNGRATPGN
jgi:hypothetical protein